VDFLLCDDHRLFASALSWALEARGHRVVAVLDRPDQLVAAVEALAPDVCLVDLEFPDASPVDAIASVSGRTRVIVLSGYSDTATRELAAASGAVDCLDKALSVERVVAISEAVHAGTYVPQVEAKPRAQGRTADNHLGRFLTVRENEVLRGLVHGDSTSALAKRLGVRPATARTHVQNVLTKLCVHSRVAAAAYAMEHGIIEAPQSASLQR
jgi:two-component system, NarL family, nitrate/nitrite response regulator NarL